MVESKPLRAFLYDLPIAAKMAVAPVVLIVVLVLFASVSTALLFQQIGDLKSLQTSREMVTEAGLISERLSDVHAELYRLSVRAISTSNLIVPNLPELEAMRSEILKTFDEIDARQAALFARTDQQHILEPFAEMPSVITQYRIKATKAAELATFGTAESLAMVERADGEYDVARQLAMELSRRQIEASNALHNSINRQAQDVVSQFVIITAIVMLLVIPLVWCIARHSVARIQNLASSIQRFSGESDSQAAREQLNLGVFAHPGSDEIGYLTNTYRAMATHVQENMRLLRHKTAEKEKAYQDLRNAQNSLIEAEKLAALGSLVAGIAHEVNTPIGVALTGASHLQERTDRFARSFEEGSMRKSELVSFIETARQSSSMILVNAMRASELIASFKEIAVDQTSEEHRQFNLSAYVEEIILSLSPKLRKVEVELDIRINPNINMVSYPGAISQILTNLILNSLLHAFEGRSHGTISITAEPDTKQRVKLTFSDDGKGMRPDQARHAFDPFFTTKRGSGGSGLGLHIVYNLVTAKLKGIIGLDTAPGEGVTFTLYLPFITPEDTAGWDAAGSGLQEEKDHAVRSSAAE